jgi:hypothetical protein
MKTFLKVKFELLIPVLFITLFVMSVIHIGFFRVSDIIFNILVFLSIPASYFAIKFSRKTLLYVWYGEKYENK